jgi:hypothetical protein
MKRVYAYFHLFFAFTLWHHVDAVAEFKARSRMDGAWLVFFVFHL